MNNKLFHAIVATATIAYNSGSGAISGKVLAQGQGLPPRYLEALLQELVKSGILRSQRGPKGGYVLAKERRRITLGDICEVLGEEEIDHPVTPLGAKVIKPVWDNARAAWLAAMHRLDLADILRNAEERKIPTLGDVRSDFMI